METKSNQHLRWTVLDTVVGQPLLLIIVIAVVSTLLNPLCDLPLIIGAEASIKDYQTYVTLARLCKLLCPAVCFVCSLIVITAFCNWRLGTMDPETAQKYHARGRKFKWHCLYSLAATVFVLLLFMLCLSFILFVLRPIFLSLSDNIVLVLIGGVIGLVAVPVFFWLVWMIGSRFYNWINPLMVRITGTNAELIDEVLCGMYDNAIPVFFGYQATHSDIIKFLAIPLTYDVTTAAFLLFAWQKIKGLSKFLAPIAKIYLAFVGLLTILGIAIIHSGVSEASSDLSDGIQAGVAQAINGSGDDHAKYYAQEEARKKKWFEADKAKKKADFDRYQANKAAAYNANSYDAYKKNNLAKKSYEKSKKANREKYF